MYPISEAFLRMVQENTRRYEWSGKITTIGGRVYEFTSKDIVKGSGYITRPCCGNNGIDMGENYNKPDNPNKRVPKCPKAKEEMIIEALKHFKMLEPGVEMIV